VQKIQKILLCVNKKDIINRIEATITKTALPISTLLLKETQNLHEILESEDIDYLLIDQYFEGYDCQEMLTFVEKKYPYIVRILLVDKFSQDIVIMVNKLVHLILEKKILEGGLADLLTKANSLRKLLKDGQIVKIINTFQNIPELKSEHITLLHHLQSSDSSMKKIGEMIEKDIALSAKVLQTVNLSVYAYSGQSTSITQAVVYLGVNVIRALIIHMQVFQLKTKNRSVLLYLHIIEKHSLRLATLAKELAEIFKMDQTTQNDVFVAGLLHDIGKFVLLLETDIWTKIEKLMTEQGMKSFVAEDEVIMTSHETIGAYLLITWGFPLSIVDAVAYHHKPSLHDSNQLSTVSIIHIADAMLDGENIRDEETFLKYVDMDYLQRINIKHQTMAAFKAVCTPETMENPTE